jgi:hypothetical protein
LARRKLKQPTSGRHRPEVGLLPDGKRLHLHDGPIDLIVEKAFVEH